MPFVAIVTVLALLQFLWLSFQVGFARTRYGVAAPATSGNEMFERRFLVNMNTLEQLVMFLPDVMDFRVYISPLWAAALGVVFILGRAVYAISYVRDPKTRSLGFRPRCIFPGADAADGYRGLGDPRNSDGRGGLRTLFRRAAQRAVLLHVLIGQDHQLLGIEMNPRGSWPCRH